ncbi:hypothetical protein EJ02DRAFT_270344 [Clathrospora elynae]|uniref:Uncharacterized protein n=1 Tax=Clathrospora elynae TaxID=706981 RepID=A0A6A5SK29_9PLEO|nr:hypothetical protein EJ02DRAFT_270344 [Clathrospora elynae]
MELRLRRDGSLELPALLVYASTIGVIVHLNAIDHVRGRLSFSLTPRVLSADSSSQPHACLRTAITKAFHARQERPASTITPERDVGLPGPGLEILIGLLLSREAQLEKTRQRPTSIAFALKSAHMRKVGQWR